MASIRAKVGKRVGGMLYAHVSAINSLPSLMQKAVVRAAEIAALSEAIHFNVVKVSETDDIRNVSLLLYQDFDAVAFPALLMSYTVDLCQGTVQKRSYGKSSNPPILHRKELLLLDDDPRTGAFQRLTQAVEEAGLFSEPTRIGFRRQWEDKIKHAGYVLEGHKLNKVKVK